MDSKAFVFVFGIFICTALSPNVTSKETESIKLILNNWSSQRVLSFIIGNLLEQDGYRVEYIEYPTDGQWFLLKSNLAHIQVEVWQGTMEEKFQQLINSNQLLDAGTYHAYTREEWWYPDYVEQMCPGLPNWQALNLCANMFSGKKGATKGIYFAGPWEKPDHARVRALNLKFEIIKLESAEALWLKLEQAVAIKRPILLFNWTPNWVGAKYAGKFIEFPEHHADCENKPEWGINPNFLHDCGNPRKGWLKKAASIDLKQKWPCAFELLTRVNLTNDQFEEIAGLVSLKRTSEIQAAKIWLAKYPVVWQSWKNHSCVQ